MHVTKLDNYKVDEKNYYPHQKHVYVKCLLKHTSGLFKHMYIST
jgi:hypothetical protein